MTPASEAIELRGVRGMIAAKMQESLRDTAQLSFFAVADATALILARSAWRKTNPVGFEDLVIAALVAPLRDFPTLNAVEQDRSLRPSSEINVSCAIDLTTGLVAPAIFDVATKSVVEISEERRALVERARAGKLSIREMTEGTITISNLGGTRVRAFTPILNRPQQAILGLGQIYATAKVDPESSVVTATREMVVSLTVDHRFTDGARAGAFLTALCEAIESIGVPP